MAKEGGPILHFLPTINHTTNSIFLQFIPHPAQPPVCTPPLSASIADGQRQIRGPARTPSWSSVEREEEPDGEVPAAMRHRKSIGWRRRRRCDEHVVRSGIADKRGHSRWAENNRRGAVTRDRCDATMGPCGLEVGRGDL